MSAASSSSSVSSLQPLSGYETIVDSVLEERVGVWSSKCKSIYRQKPQVAKEFTEQLRSKVLNQLVTDPFVSLVNRQERRKVHEIFRFNIGNITIDKYFEELWGILRVKDKTGKRKASDEDAKHADIKANKRIKPGQTSGVPVFSTSSSSLSVSSAGSLSVLSAAALSLPSGDTKLQDKQSSSSASSSSSSSNLFLDLAISGAAPVNAALTRISDEEEFDKLEKALDVRIAHERKVVEEYKAALAKRKAFEAKKQSIANKEKQLATLRKKNENMAAFLQGN